MPIDYSIPLQVQTPNFGSNQGKFQVMQMAELLDDKKLRNLQMNKLQSDLDTSNQLKEGLQGAVSPEGGIDTDKVMQAHLDAGKPLQGATWLENYKKAEQESSLKALEYLDNTWTLQAKLLAASKDPISYRRNYELMLGTVGPEMMEGVPEQYDPKFVQQALHETLEEKDRIQIQLDKEKFAETKRHNRATENRSPLSVNINEKGAVREAEKLAEVRAMQFDKIRDTALVAEEQNLGLQQIENIDVQTGLGQSAITQVSRAINALGGDGEKLTGVDPANVQAFNSITGKLVLDVMATQKGPQTDKDQARIAKTLPNIGNEQLANQFNINSLKALNFRKIEMAEFYENYLEDKETLKGADRAWAKFKNETPLLSDQVKNADTGLPMFFHEFKVKTLERNPNATETQIINAWREIN